MANVDADMIVWIDKTGSDRRDASRRYGYHLRGMTPVLWVIPSQSEGNAFQPSRHYPLEVLRILK